MFEKRKFVLKVTFSLALPVVDAKAPYLFTSATVIIPVRATPKHGTESIRYVTLHLRDWRGATSLLYRNSVEITALSGIISVPAQKLSVIVQTWPKAPSSFSV